MKLFGIALFASAAEASHFRAIAYAITDKDANTVTVSRTMAWKHGSGGYGGCDQTDVANQTPSTSLGFETCSLMAGGSCGHIDITYIVTNIEDQLVSSNNYCYGYREVDFEKPSGPYEISYGGCCWVPFTDDQNQLVQGGSYGIIASIYDQNNNTPSVKLPPIWKIMAGCDAQTLELNPVDLDRNTIKCRWSNSAEGLGAHDGTGSFSSISLDEENCIFTYNGSQDFSTDGVKPIAIQIEDFDSNGNILSSTPIQFLATVWTPTTTNFRLLGQYGIGNPFSHASFFSEDDHDDENHATDVATRGRRQASTPAYCNDKPVLVSPSPAAGTIIPVSFAGITVTVGATSTNGAITRFQFNSPLGMTCNTVNSDGEATCSFTPSASQMENIFSFCFIADDVAGMSTERRCITLDVRASANVVDDIFTMINHRVQAFNGQFENYGCAGVNNMDADAKTKGAPLDEVDVAINKWKKCVKCAQLSFSAKYQSYDYHEDKNFCQNNIGTHKRAFCECDNQFTTSVSGQTLGYKNYQGQCTFPNNGNYSEKCCVNNDGLFSAYNENNFQCCSGLVMGLGSC